MRSTRISGFMFMFFLFSILFIRMDVNGSSTTLLQTSEDYSKPLNTDINGDGIVNILDLSIISVAVNAYPGNPNWNPTADLNGDNHVNVLDMVLLVRDFDLRWVRYDFDRPIEWNNIRGTWNVTNGSLEGFGNGEGLIYTRDTLWSDYTLTARVKIAADSQQAEAALCLCFVDPGNFYWVGLGCWNHRISISRMVSQIPEELIFNGTGAEISKDVWYVVSVRVADAVMSVYVNDVLELVLQESFFAYGGVGIRLWNSHILVDFATVSGRTPGPEIEEIPRLRGLSWYGIGSSDPIRSYRMNEEYFDFMTETFPQMNFLCLPLSAIAIMPKIYEKDYNTIDYNKLSLLKDFVSWCKSHNIKILIINYWRSADREGLEAYWRFMAQQFKDDPTMIGFDLINEPWSFAHGNESLIELYEEIIDEIRQVDPDRTCYVQSMYYHHEGQQWHDVLATNPVNRSNVVYVSHLYSNDYETGEWYTNSNCPWVGSYLGHDYTNAREVLERELYERFGFIKEEFGYPVAVTEIAFESSTEGLTYGRDVLDILNEWKIDWAYHPLYTNIDRTLSLTYPDGTPRPQAGIVQDHLS